MGMAKKSKSTRFDFIHEARMRSFVAAVVGLTLTGVALFACLRLFDVYQSKLDEASEGTPQQFVLYAARDLYPGVRVEESDVFALAIPLGAIHPDMATVPEHIVGKYPKEPILRNEIIRLERIANPEKGEGLNAILPRDMRAISIDISNGAALSGNLTPGSYVDVLSTINPDDDAAPIITKTIAQSLFVLAVNDEVISLTPQQERNGHKRPRPTVTLLVTPDQAEWVAQAILTTSVYLTLRNDLDDRFEAVPGVDIGALLARLEIEEAPPARAPRPKPSPPPELEAVAPTEVLVIRGDRVEDVEVESDAAPRSP